MLYKNTRIGVKAGGTGNLMAMKVLIVEDEVPAAEKLERYLNRYDPQIEVMEKMESVENTVSWLKEHQDELDLIFLDIQLTDGLSFKIFDQVEVTKPVIFTTAFDQYAIDAFKVNSIDYLLKPITFDDLSKSLQKLDSMKENLGSDEETLPSLTNMLKQLKVQKSYKNRFMVKLGEHIRSLTTDHIAMFYAEGRNVFIFTINQGKFIIDYKMEELDEILDPSRFFRVNRTYIVNIEAIKDVLIYSNSRLRVKITPETDKEIIVSRERVSSFKAWFDGKGN